MAQDWDIRPRGSKCGACEQGFVDKQSYTTALSFVEHEYRRVDYCDACFKKNEETIQPISLWKGVFLVPPPPPDPALKKETAESLLRRLMEDENASRNVLYILAVMLERNRILLERDVQTREDGTMIRLYEHRKTAETFVIPDPRLKLDELESVQNEVMVLLGGKPRPEQGVPVAPVAGGPAVSPTTSVQVKPAE